MNRPITLIGFVLLVLAAVFYFGGFASGAAIPLLILGVLAVVAGVLTGR